MENLIKTKKLRLTIYFLLVVLMSRGGGRIKHNDNWKFKSYKGTDLGYDLICESINSDQEEKKVDLLNGNRIINLNNLITNMDKFLM